MHESPFIQFLTWGNGAGVFVFIAADWLVMCLVVSWWSGWHLLADRYRCEREFEGQRWRFQSGQMRWGCGYHNGLTLGANADGLYMAVLAMIRPGSPPLFIPWVEITAREEKRWMFDGVKFTLGRDTQIPLWVFKSTGEKLLAHRGDAYTLRASDSMMSR